MPTTRLISSRRVSTRLAKAVLTCDVCGVTSETKTVKRSTKYPSFGTCFCSKHLSQLYRHGYVTDMDDKDPRVWEKKTKEQMNAKLAQRKVDSWL